MDIPVYGSIPYFGDAWSIEFEVQHRPNGNFITHSLSGYGSFPFEKYPLIPVIDFRTAHGDKLKRYLALSNEVRPKEVNPAYKGSLEGYLNAVKEIGIEVL